MVTREDDEPAAAPTPALAVAAVARRLGVAPATLRTWDRRYGLGPSEHSAGAHRRYSATDVERLLVMRRLTLDGVAPVGVRADRARDRRRRRTRHERRTTRRPRRRPPWSTPRSRATSRGAPGCSRSTRAPDVVLWWTSLVEPVLAALARRTVVDPPGVDATFAVHAGVLAALRDRPVPLGGRTPAGRPGPGRRRARPGRSSRTSSPARSRRRASTRASSAGPWDRTTRSSSPR